MALFKKAETTSAFLKMGIMGFQGSGKTFTATHTAIGLVKLMRERDIQQGAKPAYFLDTETGVDWVTPAFGKAGVELRTAKTRAFKDLREAVIEAEADGSVLIIDSISAFWAELTESYAKQKNRTRGLEFQDWAFLKRTWRLFTDQFINSNLHIILCGRAGYEYDFFEDDAGKKQLEKTGVKMKAEGEMGYEPSLLVMMERETDPDSLKVTRTATVLKDRSTLLDGKKFVNPAFATFLPHINLLTLGGKQLGLDTTRNSEGIIPKDAPTDKQAVRRAIVIDEIEDLMTLHIPGQGAGDKKRKIELLRKHFNAGWVEIEKLMPLAQLRMGYDSLHVELTGEPSRYAMPAVTPASDEPLPTFDKPANGHVGEEFDLPPTELTGTLADLMDNG